jgi:hypothetical protein
MIAARAKKRGSQQYTAAEFRPYVAALGQLTLAWNDLQESLAALFWTTMLYSPPLAGDFVNYTPLWVWHSIKSDRSQREMLKAAIDHSHTAWKRPSFVNDGKWLLDRAGELEDARNDAIHSPLFSVDKSLYGMAAGPEKVAQAYWLFNPRAKKLAKRDNLLRELRYCRDAAITLSDYAREIDRALINPSRPWPKKPLQPSRTPRTGRQARRQPQPK